MLKETGGNKLVRWYHKYIFGLKSRVFILFVFSNGIDCFDKC